MTPLPKTRIKLSSVKTPLKLILTNDKFQEKERINDFADPGQLETEKNLLD